MLKIIGFGIVTDQVLPNIQVLEVPWTKESVFLLIFTKIDDISKGRGTKTLYYTNDNNHLDMKKFDKYQ